MSRGKILLQLTGSIACFKACALISQLVQHDFEVEVVTTRSALEFVGLATLEGLTGRRVHTDTFEAGRYMSHIHLAKWADLSLIYPATANTLGKLANGIGDDLLSTLFLAHDFEAGAAAVWIAPAMNVKMYRHPATQQSLEKLKAWGVQVLDTGAGHLACGDLGEGRLLEPALVLEKIEAYFASRALHRVATATPVPSDPTSASPAGPGAEPVAQTRSLGRKRVLVTAGGTREPIDGVRAITNTSSGKTGADIADQFASYGHQVTLLRARDAQPAYHKDLVQKTYSTFASLQDLLKTELQTGHYDVVIHLAAVADYSVTSIEADGQRYQPGELAKLDSQGDLTIRLGQNPKLVDMIHAWSGNPRLQLVAFKLTNTVDRHEQLNAVKKLALRSGANWIVHNDLHGIQSPNHLFTLFAAAPAGRSSETELQEIALVSGPHGLAQLIENQLHRSTP